MPITKRKLPVERPHIVCQLYNSLQEATLTWVSGKGQSEHNCVECMDPLGSKMCYMIQKWCCTEFTCRRTSTPTRDPNTNCFSREWPWVWGQGMSLTCNYKDSVCQLGCSKLETFSPARHGHTLLPISAVLGMASESLPKAMANKCYQSESNFDPFIPSEIVHLLSIAVISVFFLRQGFKSLNRMFRQIVFLTWTVLSTTPFTVMCIMIISSHGWFLHTGLLNYTGQ